MGACRPSCPSAAAASSTYAVHTRRQPFRILAFARRSHTFCFQLYESIFAVLSIPRLLAECLSESCRDAKVHYTRRASISFAAFPPPTSWPSNQGTQHSCDDIHPSLLLPSNSPSDLGSQKLLINNNRKYGRHCRELVQHACRGWWAGGQRRHPQGWNWYGNAPPSRVTGYQLTYMRIGVVTLDPWLSPFKDSLKRRYSKAQDWIKTIQDTEGGLDKFSKVWLMGWDNVRSHGADSHIRGPTPWDCT